MDTPEANSTEVLTSCTSSGFRGQMPVGGQRPPSSGVEARLEWLKNLEKASKKRGLMK